MDRRRARVELCGDVAISGPDGHRVPVRIGQVQAVVAVVVLADRPVSRDELADALWDENLPAHWQGALRSLVAKARQAFRDARWPAGVLSSEGATVRLEIPGGLDSDVAEAAQALEDAEAAAVAGRPAEAVGEAERALDILRRPFLTSLDTSWARARRQDIDTRAQRAARVHLTALLASGRPAEAAAAARVQVAAQPLDEAAWALLIEALVADGQRAGALRAHAELADVLAVELGIAPDTRTTALLEGLRAPARPSRTPGGHHHGPFVGRAAEMTAIEAAWRRVVDEGRPAVVVLEGPAGIGKTRLAQWLTDRWRLEGVPVAWGRSRLGDGRAFGAFAELAGDALGADPALLDRVGARGSGLVALLPQLADRFPAYQRPADDAAARTHVFAAASALVEELAARPAVAVLDDLHWATDDTMALLDACLDGLTRPLLVLVTTRPPPPGAPRRSASLPRVAPVEHITPGGLDAGEVTELVAGHAAPYDRGEEALGAAVHRRTSGLPFFVTELLRSARRAGDGIDPAAMPEVVRDWLAQQVAALPANLVDLVERAAVIGPEVDVALLARTGSNPPDDHARLVDALVASGLLHDDGGGATVSFSHVITRDAVYDGLGPARRARLHRRVADALAAGPPFALRSDALARHYARAGPDARTLAAAHACAAGREAMAVGAWEQAASSFEASLAADPAPVGRVRALVGLGQARQRLRRFDTARRDLEEAIEVAFAHDLPEELAEATLATVGRAGRGVSPDRAEQAVRLRAALASLTRTDEGATGDRRRRSVLLGHLERELAVALLLTGALAERDELLGRALARARALSPPDPSCLVANLLAQRMVTEQLDDPHRHLVDIDEALALSAGRLAPDLHILARCYRHADLLRLGRRAEADAELAGVDVLLEGDPDPYWRWASATWRGLGRLLDGDLVGAERQAHEAAALLPGVAEATACLGVNLVAIRLYQGRAAEVVDLLAAAVAAHPEIPCYRAVLALCASEAGDRSAAAANYEWFAAGGFTGLPSDTNRFLGLAVLAHVAADLRDIDGGAVLTGLLAPTAGQLVVLDCYGGGGAAWGPVTHALARLATLAGSVDEADALFAQATAQAAGSPLALRRIIAHRQAGSA